MGGGGGRDPKGRSGSLAVGAVSGTGSGLVGVSPVWRSRRCMASRGRALQGEIAAQRRTARVPDPSSGAVEPRHGVSLWFGIAERVPRLVLLPARRAGPAHMDCGHTLSLGDPNPDPHRLTWGSTHRDRTSGWTTISQTPRQPVAGHACPGGAVRTATTLPQHARPIARPPVPPQMVHCHSDTPGQGGGIVTRHCNIATPVGTEIHRQIALWAWPGCNTWQMELPEPKRARALPNGVCMPLASFQPGETLNGC